MVTKKMLVSELSALKDKINTIEKNTYDSLRSINENIRKLIIQLDAQDLKLRNIEKEIERANEPYISIEDIERINEELKTYKKGNNNGKK